MSAAASGILLVHDGAVPRADILSPLLSRYAVLPRRLKELDKAKQEKYALMIVDVTVHGESDARTLFDAIKRVADWTLRRLFIIDSGNRKALTNATAMGASALVSRPISLESLYSSVDRLIFEAGQDQNPAHQIARAGVTAGVDVIEQIMQFAVSGHRLTQTELYGQGDRVVDALNETGLGDWIQAVKQHHSRTFRHSLLVTGVAVGFGQMLGFSLADQKRLALGALLHDIGKARISLDILEKPGSLDPVELEEMRRHASYGRDVMVEKGGFSDEMIDVVAHHHEMLDGSGYPDGLAGNQIRDLVRTITVADIFAALIEERSYKARKSAADAYDIMLGMEGKLDPALLRAFSHVALRTPLGT